ncbi:hypothetical protein SAMN05444680_102324 [Variovorax sp. YR216]|nr:hypothetical protein SAMN05444680_102324 [Variovorax sp. YR216]
MCPRAFRPIVFAALVIVISACHPQSATIQSRTSDSGMAGHLVRTEANPIAGGPAAYFGDLFSREEAALASKPADADSPTF